MSPSSPGLLMAIALTLPGASSADARELTFEQRVQAQEAIERIWPPNHRMVEVFFSVSAEDACDALADRSPDVILAAVTSSEPDDAPGRGDGSTAGDIQGAAIGSDDRRVLLRAERAGSGGGRTYTVIYRAVDLEGNVTTASAQVFVPHDAGGTESLLTRSLCGSPTRSLRGSQVDGIAPTGPGIAA